MNIETKAKHEALSQAVANADSIDIQTAGFASSKDKLLADLKVVVADADKLIRAVATSSVDELAAARARVEAKLDEAKANLGRATGVVSDGAKKASDATCAYVKQNPWSSMGICVVAGVITGMLFRRRKALPAAE